MLLFAPGIPKNLYFQTLKLYKVCVAITFLNMMLLWGHGHNGEVGKPWSEMVVFSPVYDLSDKDNTNPLLGPFQGFS